MFLGPRLVHQLLAANVLSFQIAKRILGNLVAHIFYEMLFLIRAAFYLSVTQLPSIILCNYLHLFCKERCVTYSEVEDYDFLFINKDGEKIGKKGANSLDIRRNIKRPTRHKVSRASWVATLD